MLLYTRLNDFKLAEVRLQVTGTKFYGQERPS